MANAGEFRSEKLQVDRENDSCLKVEQTKIEMVPKKTNQEVLQRKNVFLAKNSKQNCMKIEGAYDNVAFNSGSSDEDDAKSHTSSKVCRNPRKRANLSTSEKKTVFRKAGDYIVAELENMETDKAQILLNKTLRFFVDHRYDNN